MSINGRTRVRTLVTQHPDAADTLSWYGIEVADHDLDRTLEDICRVNKVNYWEVKADLVSTVEDDDADMDGFDFDEDDEEDDYGEFDDFMR